MAGRRPSGNWMSRTGPMIATIFPTFCSAMTVPIPSERLLERRGARHDLDQFLRDARLTRAVVGQGQLVDELARVLRGGAHGRHPRAHLGGGRFREGPEHRELEVA